MGIKRELMGHYVAVVALSAHQTDYVPLSEATFFTLFPDVVHRRGTEFVLYRLGSIRVSRDSSGHLVGHCTKWWEPSKLVEARRENIANYARPCRALEALQRALQRDVRSPFGEDLSIFVDSTTSYNRSLDWGVLEADVFRGMNSLVPFEYRLARRHRWILEQLPFVDLDEHFRGTVPTPAILSLIRQLLEQHTRSVRGMSLVPARWLNAVRADDVVVVETGVPMVIRFGDPWKTEVRVGALQVGLGRSGSGRDNHGRGSRGSGRSRVVASRGVPRPEVAADGGERCVGSSAEVESAAVANGAARSRGGLGVSGHGSQ